MKHSENKKTRMRFKGFVRLYILILIIVMIVALVITYNDLKAFESYQVDNYMQSVIVGLKEKYSDSEIEKYIDKSSIAISDFENKDKNIAKGIKASLRNEEVGFKLNKDSEDEINPVYDIYVNGEKTYEITLDGSKSVSKLANLLKFNEWKVSNIKLTSENGIYSVNISVPNNLKVFVNDKELTDKNFSKTYKSNSDLEQITLYIAIPQKVDYTVSNLIMKPNVKIVDENNNEVTYKEEKNNYSVDISYEKIENYDEAIAKIKEAPNILEIAENWSLYLSDDLNGKLHGFYNIAEYLINDSYLYNYAHDWATNVDITFISAHTLLNPRFTNETISNFVIYNENAFSCEVYLDKNLKLTRTGATLTDSMHERMYFAYFDDTDDNKDNPTWKLVNMQSVA